MSTETIIIKDCYSVLGTGSPGRPSRLSLGPPGGLSSEDRTKQRGNVKLKRALAHVSTN